MKLIRFIVDFILFTSLFTAACAVGLCMATGRLITGRIPDLFQPFHVFVFSATMLVYNVHSYVKAPSAMRKGLAMYTPKYRLIHLLLAVTGLVLLFVYLPVMQWQLIAFFCALGLCSFAYSLPMLPLKNKKRIREFGWLKILALAGVWTIVTSVLPMLYVQKSVLDFPWEVLLRFSFIFSLCIIFDLRDVNDDIANNIRTLPSRLGLRNSYRLINFAILLFILFSTMQYIRVMEWPRLTGALVTGLAIWLVARYLRQRPSERGYLILADGVMIFYAVLILYLG